MHSFNTVSSSKSVEVCIATQSILHENLYQSILLLIWLRKHYFLETVSKLGSDSCYLFHFIGVDFLSKIPHSLEEKLSQNWANNVLTKVDLTLPLVFSIVHFRNCVKLCQTVSNFAQDATEHIFKNNTQSSSIRANICTANICSFLKLCVGNEKWHF